MLITYLYDMINNVWYTILEYSLTSKVDAKLVLSRYIIFFLFDANVLVGLVLIWDGLHWSIRLADITKRETSLLVEVVMDIINSLQSSDAHVYLSTFKFKPSLEQTWVIYQRYNHGIAVPASGSLICWQIASELVCLLLIIHRACWF